MSRRLSSTLLAIAIGWFSLVSTLGGVAGLLLATGPRAQLGPWLGATLLVTGLLGLRAARLMWREESNTSAALRLFVAVGAMNPIALYAMFPQDQRSQAFWPVVLGTATFVAVGIWVTHKTRALSSGAV